MKSDLEILGTKKDGQKMTVLDFSRNDFLMHEPIEFFGAVNRVGEWARCAGHIGVSAVDGRGGLKRK